MACKVFPQKPMCSNFISSQRTMFTIWMKSLVFHSYGCTVFDSDGELVFRIDNYDKRCSNEVYLMGTRGQVLVTIRRKHRIKIFQHIWCGYKWSTSSDQNHDHNMKMERPWFHVKKLYRWMFKGNLACEINLLGVQKYRVVKLSCKESFKIVHVNGDVVAEVKPKQTTLGVMLGKDVLSMIVEPQVDYLLIMAIVIVYGLINFKL